MGSPKPRKVTLQGSTFYVIGDERRPLRDLYHTFLQAPWPVSLAMIAGAFLVMNLGFATVYMATGGVAGSTGSFLNSLSFSVQTMATIGYGDMHPATSAAHIAIIAESMLGLIVTALSTGLVFAKFSRPTTRVAFSKHALVGTYEGKPTLMFKIGNRRTNVILEAQVHVVAVITTLTAEGSIFYKSVDLPLVRERHIGMARGWTIMHVIDEQSPLYGKDAAAIAADELELYTVITGLDNITMQTVHSAHMYTDRDIQFGARFADTLSPHPDGTFIVDLRKFDTVIRDRAPE